MKILTNHVFLMMEIADKIDLVSELENIKNKSAINIDFDENDTAEQKLKKINNLKNLTGGILVAKIAIKLYKAKDLVVELLADLKQCSIKDIQKMDLAQLKELITEVINEGVIEAFFKQAISQDEG